MRDAIRGLINAAFGRCGLRVVNAAWGPTGFAASLRKVAARGWIPHQIVDIGAWKGTWAAECMRIFPEAQYLLIDPLPENRADLMQFKARHANVSVWLGAAGAEDGEITIHVHADQSSVLPAVEASWQSEETISVPVRTLDSLLLSGEMARPQLIKADVQGYELEVLRGASRVLAAADAVLLEVSFRELYEGQPLAHDIIAYLGARGFRIADICSYAQSADGALQQSDVLFLREGFP